MNKEVTFGTNNRISIPTDVVKMLNLKQGMKLDLEVVNNSIVLKTPQNNIQEEDVKTNKTQEKSLNKVSTQKTQTKVKTNISKPSRQIVSNLEEGQKFYKKYYSPCNLVIRTKTRYIKEFCEDCKGQLAEEYHVDKTMCPYLSNSQEESNTENKCTTKQNETVCKLQDLKATKKSIETSLKRLNYAIEHKINTIENIDMLADSFKKQLSTTIQPVKYKYGYFQQCKQCKQLVVSGFLLDGKFHCKECTIENFSKVLAIYKQLKKKED